MNLYAESSAVLAWLLGEPEGVEMRQALGSAEVVVTSDLTVVECERVLIRAAVLGELPEADAASRRADLHAASDHWVRLHVGTDTLDRAGRRFPDEPVRTLDALHLASALVGKAAIGDLVLLSLDRRIRQNARALNFDLHPPGDLPAS